MKERGKDVKLQIKLCAIFSFSIVIATVIYFIETSNNSNTNFVEDAPIIYQTEEDYKPYMETSNNTNTNFVEDISSIYQAEQGYKPYTVNTFMYEDEYGNQVEYPAISSLSDVEIQKQINDLLLEHALVYMNAELDNSLEISYEIKRCDNIISIAYYGSVYYSNTPRPHNYFYTINIDIKTGEVIDTEKIATIDEDMLLLALQSLWIKPIEADYIESITLLLTEEITSGFWDSLGTINHNDSINVYLTETSIGIRFYVPYAYGSYVIVEIPIESSQSTIVTNSDITNQSSVDESLTSQALPQPTGTPREHDMATYTYCSEIVEFFSKKTVSKPFILIDSLGITADVGYTEYSIRQNIPNITFVKEHDESIIEGLNIGSNMSDLFSKFGQADATSSATFVSKKDHMAYIYYMDGYSMMIYGEDVIEIISFAQMSELEPKYDMLLNDIIVNKKVDDYVNMERIKEQYPSFSTLERYNYPVQVYYPNGIVFQQQGYDVYSTISFSVQVFQNYYTDWKISERQDIVYTDNDLLLDEFLIFCEVYSVGTWLDNSSKSYSVYLGHDSLENGLYVKDKFEYGENIVRDTDTNVSAGIKYMITKQDSISSIFLVRDNETGMIDIQYTQPTARGIFWLTDDVVMFYTETSALRIYSAIKFYDVKEKVFIYPKEFPFTPPNNGVGYKLDTDTNTLVFYSNFNFELAPDDITLEEIIGCESCYIVELENGKYIKMEYEW